MPHGEEAVTNLIVTWQDIERLEKLPIYQIHGAFDDYPFPYDDAARVIIFVPPTNTQSGMMTIISVLPSGMSGTISGNGKNSPWEWDEKGYVLYPPDYNGEVDEKTQRAVRFACHLIHCAVTALRMISAFSLPRIEAQKRDIKRVTKGMSRTPETKTDKYYILKLSGRSLDYLPEPQEKCRAGAKHRWHMCRGHYRHLKSGKVIFVKGHYRGDKTLGIIHKDYAL